MIIGSVSENKNTEKRISVTPENVKKFISNGFKVYLEKNYGNHLDIDDEKFDNDTLEAIRQDTVVTLRDGSTTNVFDDVNSYLTKVIILRIWLLF